MATPVSKDVQDVEMKDVDEEKSNAEEENPVKIQKDKDVLSFEDLKEQMKFIEKGVSQKEQRYTHRAIRCLQSLRKKMNDAILRKTIIVYYPTASTAKEPLLNYLEEPMETDEAIVYRPRSSKLVGGAILPELDAFLHLLILLRLLDTSSLEQAKECSDSLMSKITTLNRRSMDFLSARAFNYHSRVYELMGRLADVRSFFQACLRTATLRHNEEGQACLINLLLRNYLHYNLYDQADKLVSKSVFPPNANNNEWARHLYYLGRIRAVQLDYSDAHKNLLQAIRKAPQNSAIGFKQTAHKFAVVVQLLLGEIPDRATFREPILKKPLTPYLQVTQAVRRGDLDQFGRVLDQYGAQFQKERTYTLIIRLRHNVIKTGIRMISLSYSRISMSDIAQKLLLDSAEDAEYIVAKAIRDGVIEASIDHERGFMRSKENIDIYNTKEPQEAFHQRILFCLELYNQSVKAMRYPPKSYRNNFESVEDRREREQQDMELAKEMTEEDEDEDFP